MKPTFTDLRDGLILADFPGVSDDAANRAAVALARALSEAGAGLGPRGLRDAIPAARTLLLSFDPLRLSHDAVRAAASRARLDAPAGAPARTLELPAAFDGDDLDDVATAAGLSAGELVAAYTAAEYRVAFLGFSPGFPYMTGLPEKLRTPRLPTPRLRVPAGSVAIGGGWTGVYPSATPGGWRLIGRSATRIFDPRRSPPALFAAGDRVRFVAVGESIAPPPRGVSPTTALEESRGAPLFRVIRPGLWSAIVGAPRWGMASSGIPPGGPMDARAFAAANAAAGNPAGAGALEMAVDGPELEALAPCVAAVRGAERPLACGGSPRPHGQPFAVAAGDRLSFGRARKGMRSYLAIAGGLREAEETWQTRRLDRGDALFAAVLGTAEAATATARSPHAADAGAAGMTLRAIPGPHAGMFTPGSVDAFFAAEWRVSPQSDRRGLRLEGARLRHARPEDAEVPPVGAAPGSVQVPGGGEPIVLGPDGPVTGGYPRIATVIGADLHLLGRAAPGDLLRFAPATLGEALAAASRAGREYD
ncbi:MAG TPA: carboxyltransferase domain-containing protein [Thermoanaerobaculia bacterium]|nr:carboxyltransferase domain-containing protein [Thermoanaerobaculia bacterium]